jgi:hypothetical protein
LNLEHSYKYRPLDAYLIDRDRWNRDRTLLIERAGLQAFVDPQPGASRNWTRHCTGNI